MLEVNAEAIGTIQFSFIQTIRFLCESLSHFGIHSCHC